MSNWLMIHTPSNLVMGIIASSRQPKSTPDTKFITVTDKQLDKYYQLQEKCSGKLVDFGALLKASPSLLELYTGKAWEVFQQGVTARKRSTEYPCRIRQRRAKIRKAA
ncbi:hypothetical protein [Aquipseudomonas ullengensis]|uniref:Uncharacterized protein n=1 Tax=Aquipseudomonas ullengensis TaxID=2759166 RepID=A0A7W4LMN6_9GAMM|nr:hypothetical protein [Pseudomonas ullengensis]MBB2495955.1 hypothetical protein [Pseudomonas ullengensis]